MTHINTKASILEPLFLRARNLVIRPFILIIASTWVMVVFWWLSVVRNCGCARCLRTFSRREHAKTLFQCTPNCFHSESLDNRVSLSGLNPSNQPLKSHNSHARQALTPFSIYERIRVRYRYENKTRSPQCYYYFNNLFTTSSRLILAGIFSSLILSKFVSFLPLHYYWY